MRGVALLVVCVIEVVYLIFGGFVFWALEDYGPGALTVTNVSVKGSVDAAELIRFVDNQIDKETGCINRTQLVDMLKVLSMNSYKNVSDQWSIAGSIFFAMTIVSTIGYGNFVPSTTASQTFTCFYAIVGIPLTLVMMVGLGEVLNSFFTLLENKLRSKCPRIGKVGSSLIILCLGVVFFVLIPAIIFAELQGWSYGTAIYFEIVSFTTIGFGDYVAGFPCPARAHGGSSCEVYRVATGIWIYMGLAWLSGLISSLQTAFGSAIMRVDFLSSIVEKYISKPKKTSPNDVDHSDDTQLDETRLDRTRDTAEDDQTDTSGDVIGTVGIRTTSKIEVAEENQL